LELGIGVWAQKNYNDGAIGPNKKFDDIFSHVDTIHQRDRRTPDDNKDRAMQSVARVNTT